MFACYRNGNNNIRIVGLAVVKGESESTWSWFLMKLKEKLTFMPSFYNMRQR